MPQNHPYCSFQVPGHAPFELKPSPGKGWGAFATRQINRGDAILREKPLFVIWKPHELITEEDIRTTFQRLKSSAKQQFLHLRDNAGEPFKLMEDAFAENSFALSRRVRPLDNVSPGHGLYLLHSRFNHSCVPNSKIPTINDEIIATYATRNIMAGEEITFCYNTDFECRNSHERHQVLRFICECKACLPGTAFQQLSDIRRTFVRGLQYLSLGIDLDGERQDCTSPIIVDPELKNAAEHFRIKLSSRLIYTLLTIYLLEEEGLLDDFMAERLNPSVPKIVETFQNEGNIRIARLAMTRETSLEKFCMAFRLYRRADIADHIVADGLQQLQVLSRRPLGKTTQL